MDYHDNILGLIGHTPLVKLNRLTRGIKATLLAKMENLNPGYSVKDRIGVAMIEAAEREGILKPGGTVVEATSGNTGIGLALAACVKGYKCIFVMTDKSSVEKSRYLKALGADVVITPVSAKPGTPDHYVSTAKRIASETPNSFYPDQYSHPANPEAHYRTTGPEVWEQTEGKVTHFVAGIGTGGTISGTGRYLKEKNPKIKIIGADPYGSVFKTFKETGKLIEATPYLVEGIGQEVIPPNVHIKYVDDVINVTDRESFEMSRQMGRLEGLFCGGSTGTNVAAALRVAREAAEDAVIVFIVCDTGEHYLSKHHSDEWMKENRLLEGYDPTVGEVLQRRTSGMPRLVSVDAQTIARDAIGLIRQYDISQLPVLRDGRSVGVVNEAKILRAALEDAAVLAKPAADIMDAPLPEISAGETAEQARQFMAQRDGGALLVREGERITGILTRLDLIDHIL